VLLFSGVFSLESVVKTNDRRSLPVGEAPVGWSDMTERLRSISGGMSPGENQYAYAARLFNLAETTLGLDSMGGRDMVSRAISICDAGGFGSAERVAPPEIAHIPALKDAFLVAHDEYQESAKTVARRIPRVLSGGLLDELQKSLAARNIGGRVLDRGFVFADRSARRSAEALREKGVALSQKPVVAAAVVSQQSSVGSKTQADNARVVDRSVVRQRSR
jgi:hypothetical protein